MDFDLSEDQRLLKDSLTKLLNDRYDFERRKTYMSHPQGWSSEQWGRYAQMGLLALPFAESDGGLGGGAVETLIVMEAFGRVLALEPFLSTVVLCGGLLRLGGSPHQRTRLIPALAEGRLLLAFAQAEKQSRYDLGDVSTTALRKRDGWVLRGEKRYVLHGNSADQLIVSARVDGDRRDRTGIGLFIVDSGSPGLSRRGYRVQDGLRAAEITLNDVHIGADALIGEPGQALPLVERVVDSAIAALCAEAVGAMDRAHQITIDYLKTRKQFGTLIGSFQALQHRAVDMLVKVEEARSMAMYAAMMCEDPDPSERRRAISAAKVQIGQSGKFVGEQAIQLHGGIGMTDECQVGHYYRRLTMIDLLFGDMNYHLGVLARSDS